MSFLSGPADWASHEFHHALDEAGHVLPKAGDGLKNALDAAVREGYKLGKAAEEKVYNELRQAFLELKNRFRELQVLANHMKALAEHIRHDAEEFARKVEHALEVIKQKLQDLVNAIEGLAKKIEDLLGLGNLNTIVGAISDFEGHIVGGISTFLHKLNDWNDKAVEWICPDRLGRLADMLYKLVDGAAHALGDALSAAAHAMGAIPKGVEIAQGLVMGKKPNGASKHEVAESLAKLAVAIAPLTVMKDLPVPPLPPILQVPASGSSDHLVAAIMEDLNRIPDPLWEFASPKMDTAEAVKHLNWVTEKVDAAGADPSKIPIKPILAGIACFRAWIDQTKPILSIDVDIDLLDNLNLDVNAGDASGAADAGAGGDGEGGGFAGIVIFEGHAFFWGLLDIVFETLTSILGLIDTVHTAKSA